MTRILSIGDAMLDVVVKLEGEINFNSDTKASITTHGGGAGANTASWLAKLGIESHFFGKVGSDSAGAIFENELSALGVKSFRLCEKDRPTGTVVVIVAGNGERTMFPDAGANSHLLVKELPDLSGYHAVFLSGYSLYNPSNLSEVIQIIERVREQKIPMLFDPASVGTMKAFGRIEALDSIKNFDLISLNEEEALFLSNQGDIESAMSTLLEYSPIVIIKLGAHGAIAANRSGQNFKASAKSAHLVDTTGAGDAFNAGFLASWIKNQNLQSALESGNSTAAQCVEIIGARPRVAS